jgi:type IV pilus assembly protein PilV
MRINLKQQRGIGLLEVLVAMLILAIGVLGFSALQVRAVSATSEGFARAQAMGTMRMLAESMRTNPTAINTYTSSINSGSVTPPGKTCMGNNTGSELPCTPDQLAAFDSYQVNLTSKNQDMNLRLVNCPGLTESRQCILAAWGKTSPTVGASAESDCLKSDGSYHRKATCLLLEAI